MIIIDFLLFSGIFLRMEDIAEKYQAVLAQWIMIIHHAFCSVEPNELKTNQPNIIHH